MAIYRRQKVGIREIGETANVPDHPVARTMYYLQCICDVLDLREGNNNLQKLTDYKKYRQLTEKEIDGLTLLVVSVKPEALLGKCLIHDEEICGDSSNKFFELQDVRQNMVILDDILIAGQRRRVTKIMFFKAAWLERNCITPLLYLVDRIKRRAEEARRTNSYQTQSYQEQTITSYQRQTRVPTYPADQQTSSCCECTIL